MAPKATASETPPPPSLTLGVSRDDGSRIRVRVVNLDTTVQPDAVPAIFGDYWPPMGWVVTEPPEQPVIDLTVDLQSPGSLERFESSCGLYLAEQLRDYIAAHAAVVIIDDTAVVIPGRSHQGKSTLALAATRRGYTVLSDEYALIHRETGEVRGWPRPLRSRQPDGLVHRIPLPPHPTRHYPVGWVVSVRFDPECLRPFELSTQSPGDTALSLVDNTLAAQSRPEQALRAVAQVARSATGLVGTRGEADEAMEQLPVFLSEIGSITGETTAGR